MNKNALLAIIAIAVVGIFVVVLMNYQERKESPVEKVSSSISEAAEEIGDEIDDHTTSK
ncbi:MAG: hypothetical protein JNK24_03015 [Alphaproteobacteria bacterium]|nr:hypothetical protein [Alphaproteobacteria bacterium]